MDSTLYIAFFNLNSRATMMLILPQQENANSMAVANALLTKITG
jgi:hypothetical protein